MKQEAILVTGANSGIGFEITQYLNQKSHFVLAGVRRKETFSTFENMEFVKPVLLDITKEDDITNLKSFLESENIILKALVNNAGRTYNLPLYYTSMEEMKKLFEINVFGIHYLTQTFISDLIETKGRIINISSISGILTPSWMGSYSMTKHAIEAYTDCLSYELKKFGIHASVVEPGNYDTNIGSDSKEIWKNVFGNLKENIYSVEYDYMLDRMKKSSEMTWKKGVEVAITVYHALFDEHPKIRYLVTPDKMETEITLKRMIVELLQLNENHEHSFNIDEIVKMIKDINIEKLNDYHFLPWVIPRTT